MKHFLLKSLVFCSTLAYGNTPETIWTDAPPSGYVDTSPGVADLNGDGHPDLVIGTTAGMIIALTSDAQELWRQEKIEDAWVQGSDLWVFTQKAVEVWRVGVRTP